MISRHISILLCIIFMSHAEILDLECESVGITDRGLSCEFFNIYIGDTSNVNIIAQYNSSIEAINFRNSELYRVPKDIFLKFPYIKHLDVESTSLKVIELDNFRGANELKYFIARFNHIKELDDEIFVFASKLKFIVLQHNLIESIAPKAFKGLSNLEAILLDNNHVTSLPPKLLYEVPNLLHFSMSFNKLTEIPNNFLEKSTKLETLNFGHNLLTYFNDTLFDSVPNLERLQLNHNYFKQLHLQQCKSTEINVENNNLEVIELNKWTRVISAFGNPVKKLILHEHYGAGRSYNFSFTNVNEIVFFVHEHCCNVENLENFSILLNSFGDLSEKNLNENEWMCIYMKNIGYETANGFVVNDVCTKVQQLVNNLESRFDDFLETTTEDYFGEIAKVEEIFPTTTEKISRWQSFKTSVSSTAKEWKGKMKDSWNDVKNKTKGWWLG